MLTKLGIGTGRFDLAGWSIVVVLAPLPLGDTVPSERRDPLLPAMVYRHYWELCVVLAPRDGVRSGDMFVPGSRRHAARPPTRTRPSSARRGAPTSASWPAGPPVELDVRTHFLDFLTHAGGRKQARSVDLKRNLSVLIANATDLGLARMSEACGIPCDVLC